jgi:orotidine-5'-phosphate decarboxylase
MDISEKIILDLPHADLQKALALTTLFGGKVYAVKVHALLDRHGPSLLRLLMKAGASRIFVDHKLFDTPDTVAARVKALVEQGANIITVHAEGGVRMMDAAVRAGAGAVKILAVTLLTSFSHGEVREQYGEATLAKTIQLTKFAIQAGVHGIIVSGEEVGRYSRGLRQQNLTSWFPAFALQIRISEASDAGSLRRKRSNAGQLAS